MTTTYRLLGMTCGNCEAKVKTSLLTVKDVTEVSVSKSENTATVTMAKKIPIASFKAVLDAKYSMDVLQNENTESITKRSWLETYKPILLIFFYIIVLSILSQYKNDSMQWMEVMRYFMAGFFLVFSFFKFLNLQGFVESYSMYDIIAKRIPMWAYIYAFLELILGICFFINVWPNFVNTVALVVMSISLVGVVKSVLNKSQIKCACLGDVFNLPMSSVTIIEDLLMIIMSAFTLIHLNF